MPKPVACAVVHDHPPQVFVAEDEDTLNWVLALRLIARTPAADVAPALRAALREALRTEQWGTAVQLWMSERTTMDVYPSFELFTARDVDLGPMELEFTPLFQD